jgi:hypothetical protein
MSSIAICEFSKLTFGFPMLDMQTASETRKARLILLIERFGSVAALNEALSWSRTDPKLTQIRNGHMRAGRDKPYQMGDAMAREIEEKLSLDLGWMDTPPSYAEMQGDDDPRTKVMQLMEAMPPDQWPTAVRLLDALTQPANRNGTTGH